MPTILKCAAGCATAFALAAAPALADGLPVLGVDAGATGVTQPGASVRYVTLYAGRGTVVAAIDKRTGTVRRQTWMPGRLTIPAVAYDGSAAGLSRNGRWLVLLRPRIAFPQKRTRLVVLNAANLRAHRKITLHGDYSFDALSPDGAMAYVIHYTSPANFTEYEVRGLDLGSGRLTPDPIIDPREADEDMRGMPVTRATSPDGRWAYTLYDGQSDAPFIHALDTTHATARCIDLDTLGGRRDVNDLRLTLAAGTLVVRSPAARLVTVDTTTWAVAPYRAAVRSVTAPRAGGEDDSPLVWPAIGLALALACATAATLTLRGRRRAAQAP